MAGRYLLLLYIMVRTKVLSDNSNTGDVHGVLLVILDVVFSCVKLKMLGGSGLDEDAKRIVFLFLVERTGVVLAS